jgi:hypothetical protein
MHVFILHLIVELYMYILKLMTITNFFLCEIYIMHTFCFITYQVMSRRNYFFSFFINLKT